MKLLFIGLGVTGAALYNLAKECKDYETHGLDLKADLMKSVTGKDVVPNEIDVLLINLHYSRKFVGIVKEYVRRFKPELVIVNSTVVPGTCLQIEKQTDAKVVHSPIRGQHDSIDDHIKAYTKWVSGRDGESLLAARKIFEDMGLKVKTVHDTHQYATELLKLLDTTQYGMLITWAQEAERICSYYNLDHKLVREFGKETQELLGLRPDIKSSYLGGTCVRQNMELLIDFVSRSRMISAALDSNTRYANQNRVKEDLN